MAANGFYKFLMSKKINENDRATGNIIVSPNEGFTQGKYWTIRRCIGQQSNHNQITLTSNLQTSVVQNTNIQL